MSKHATGSHKDQKNASQEHASEGSMDPGNEKVDTVGSEAGTTSGPEQKVEDVKPVLELKLAEAQAEISSLKDQYLRKCADYENFRKRMQKEKEDSLKYANTNLLVDLIDIIDNFDRAVQSAESSRDFQSLHDGILMLQKQFLSMLESKYALKRFESRDQEFDPNRHEAVMSEEREGIPHALVSEDFMKGYLLHDRIVRTAKVKVAMPKADSGTGAANMEPEGANAPSPGSGE